MDGQLLEEEVSGTWGDKVGVRAWEMVEKSRWQMYIQVALLVKTFSVGPEVII